MNTYDACPHFAQRAFYLQCIMPIINTHIIIFADYNLHQNVRLISVYLTTEEYLALVPNAILISSQEPSAPQTDLHHSEVLQILREVSTECEVREEGEEEDVKSPESSALCQTSMELKDELSQAMKSHEASPVTDAVALNVMDTKDNCSGGKLDGDKMNVGASPTAECPGSLDLKVELSEAMKSTQASPHSDEREIGDVERTLSKTDEYYEREEGSGAVGETVVGGDLVHESSGDTQDTSGSIKDILNLDGSQDKVNELSTVVAQEEQKSDAKSDCDILKENFGEGTQGSSESLSFVGTSDGSVKSASSNDLGSVTSAGFCPREKEKTPRKTLSLKTTDLFNSVKIAAIKGTAPKQQKLRTWPGAGGDYNHVGGSSKSLNLSSEQLAENSVDAINSTQLVNNYETNSENGNNAVVVEKISHESDTPSETNHEAENIAGQESEPNSKGDNVSEESASNLFGNSRGTSQSLNAASYSNPHPQPVSCSIPDSVNGNASENRRNERKTAVEDGHGLVELDLYIQGHGDVAIVLLMDKSASQDEQAIANMVSECNLKNKTSLGHQGQGVHHFCFSCV